MWTTLLRDSSFFDQLHEIDQDLADLACARGCPCGGRLHRADYARKPRGAPADLPADFDRRHSFCCAREGCRRRLTPPSVRFLGRRVYVGVVVVLVTADDPGRESAAREKLFQPFFTTKGERGTGLGLSISRRIVEEQHGGTFELHSEPGAGTRVRLTIPVRSRRNEDSSEPA